MQIIIPMTGYGSRFKAAGYKQLKPFIKIHQKPMIEWVVDLFKEDKDNIIFVCRQDHLDDLPYMRSELNRIAPHATVFPVSNWEKKGPVYDVLKSKSLIRDDQACIISYCDYYMHWDYKQFKKDVTQNKCDGSIPCYTGFHPHLIPEKNLYASCKVDQNNNLLEIKEKFTWTKNKQKSLHSPGLYYFKTGSILKHYCQKMIDLNDHINNEFYASLPYNYLVKDNLKVWCPNNIPFFCQWGTPEDLEDYLFWLKNIHQHQGVK